MAGPQGGGVACQNTPTWIARKWGNVHRGDTLQTLLPSLQKEQEHHTAPVCLANSRLSIKAFYGDCSHEIKRRLLRGKKVMTNLDRILKSRDITLPTKAHLVKAMVFPVVMYGCESWTIKKAECWRIEAFELWCWRRLLRFLDCKEIKPVNPKGNQPWIFTGRTVAEAEASILWPSDVKSWLIE